MFALALAVGLTPELLPMIVTVTLARSALEMSKRKVIVKRLTATSYTIFGTAELEAAPALGHSRHF